METCQKPSEDTVVNTIVIESGLYVVATPIGCLQDFSARGIEVLSNVDWIAAEDTRHTKHLLRHFDIQKPLYALHAHNEGRQSKAMVSRLSQGDSGAYVTDAGTPGISDPGAQLVDACHASGLRVVPVPGASAVTAALSVAGFTGSSFVFQGFLPNTRQARQNHLAGVLSERRAVVCYEAPHRIVGLIEDIVSVLGGERRLLIAREMTKKFETIVRDCASKMLKIIKNDSNMRKGEFVVVIEGVSEVKANEAHARQVWGIVSGYLSHKDSVKVTAELTGVSKKIIYPWGMSDD